MATPTSTTHKDSALQGLGAALVSAFSIFLATGAHPASADWKSIAAVLISAGLAAGRKEVAVVLSARKNKKLTAQLNSLADALQVAGDNAVAKYVAAQKTESTPAAPVATPATPIPVALQGPAA